MGIKTFIRKKFAFPFPRSKNLEPLEKEIEKRLGTEIQITIGEFPPEHSYFGDSFQIDKDTKNKYWAVLRFATEKMTAEEYVHTLLHCYRVVMGFPRFTVAAGDFGMYIDNCIEHCIIFEQMVQYEIEAIPAHLNLVQTLMQVESFPQISESSLMPVQRLQLAAVATEYSYLHPLNPPTQKFLSEFRKYFLKIEEMRKELVKSVTKGIGTPEGKFLAIQKCWDLLDKPSAELHQYSRFSPKKGMEIFPISGGYKAP